VTIPARRRTRVIIFSAFDFRRGSWSGGAFAWQHAADHRPLSRLAAVMPPTSSLEFPRRRAR
jgi:hypothetical protein